MSVYWVGDIQGCDAALGQLMERIDFSASQDRLYVLGDLVNRGPDSLAVLRRLQGLGNSVQCVLGNHDLHLLAMAAGVRSPSRLDTVQTVLQAPDKEALLHWLSHQKLAMHADEVLMVHAGVLPQWSAAQTVSLAQEVEQLLQGPDSQEFLRHMYGDEPTQWHDQLQGLDRWRCVVNALTRLRFCTAQGQMEFKTKEGAGHAPAGYMPWFDGPGRKTADQVVAFGHWSTLGSLNRPDVWGLDTGCVWGGCLTAVGRNQPHEEVFRIQIPCAPMQTPG